MAFKQQKHSELYQLRVFLLFLTSYCQLTGLRLLSLLLLDRLMITQEPDVKEIFKDPG